MIISIKETLKYLSKAILSSTLQHNSFDSFQTHQMQKFDTQFSRRFVNWDLSHGYYKFTSAFHFTIFQVLDQFRLNHQQLILRAFLDTMKKRKCHMVREESQSFKFSLKYHTGKVDFTCFYQLVTGYSLLLSLPTLTGLGRLQVGMQKIFQTW